MQNRLMTKVAQAGVSMNDLDALPYADVAEDREERKDGREGRLAVHNQKGDVVDLEAICEVADTLSIIVGMCDYNDLVAAVDELA